MVNNIFKNIRIRIALFGTKMSLFCIDHNLTDIYQVQKRRLLDDLQTGVFTALSSTIKIVSVMCLAVPMQIQEIDGFMARCSAKGIERDVSLFMMQEDNLAIDDFVVVHVGYAIQKLTPQEAQTAWEIYDQMLSGDQKPGPEAG